MATAPDHVYNKIRQFLSTLDGHIPNEKLPWIRKFKVNPKQVDSGHVAPGMLKFLLFCPYEDIFKILTIAMSREFCREVCTLVSNAAAADEEPVQPEFYIRKVNDLVETYKRRTTMRAWVLSAFIHNKVDPDQGDHKYWRHDGLPGEQDEQGLQPMSEDVRAVLPLFLEATASTAAIGAKFVKSYPTSSLAKAVMYCCDPVTYSFKSPLPFNYHDNLDLKSYLWPSVEVSEERSGEAPTNTSFFKPYLAPILDIVLDICSSINTAARAEASAAVSTNKADVCHSGAILTTSPPLLPAADIVPGVVGAPPRGYGVPPDRRALKYGCTPAPCDDPFFWDFFDVLRDVVELCHGLLPDLSPYTEATVISRFRLAAELAYLALGVVGCKLDGKNLKADNLPKDKVISEEAKARFQTLPEALLEAMLKPVFAKLSTYKSYNVQVNANR